MEDKLGFIVLRHVHDTITNEYWQHCVTCIRKFYPTNCIMIIDDNSDQQFVFSSISMNNIVLIQSEYCARGELLPYYYYLKNNLFECAVIIHDSVFIQQKINFYTTTYKLLWNFPHSICLKQVSACIIPMLQEYDLVEEFNKSKSPGVFGCMTVISHKFLVELNSRYDLSLLLKHIKCRNDRCGFERVLGFLLFKCDNSHECIFGNIIKYCKWGLTFDERNKHKKLPLLKVWTGR